MEKQANGLTFRGGNDWFGKQVIASGGGTSIFDPVLCELAYRWFCPPAGNILDPFAGGSVRGIVAAKLGYTYLGIDLSERQIAANREQAAEICDDIVPVWHNGDSVDILNIAKGYAADLIFSCPPYGDLEVYSDKPNDISNMEYEDFLKAYREIIINTTKLLKEDRFAIFVVGDIRDKKGFYQRLPSYTIQFFEEAGLKLYNEAILITPAGTLPLRCGKYFDAARKLGKSHQNVLMFCKGCPKKATQSIGKVDYSIENTDEFESKYGEEL